jgi:hypothetical protein
MMTEKIIYGPVEFLPPISVNKATLEIGGIKEAGLPYTTYVFFGEVQGDDIEQAIATCNYAGCFSMVEQSSTTVRLDVRKALNQALKRRPNFNIELLTRYEGAHEGERKDPVFGFQYLEILRSYPKEADFEISASAEHY